VWLSSRPIWEKRGFGLKRILHVVGARPNFMKMAPILREMAKYPDAFAQILVHTGQHYDASMSQVFFDELELPQPNVNLEDRTLMTQMNADQRRKES